MTLFQYRDDSFFINHSLDPSVSPTRFSLHAHRNCELYYFISGEGYYTVEGSDYPLTPGCLLVMRGGEVHTPHIKCDIPYERVSVNFDPAALPLLSEELSDLFFDRPLGKNNMISPGEESSHFISECISRLCYEVDAEKMPAQILAYLMPVFLEMYHIKHSSAGGDNLRANPASGSSETVAKIIEYINAHLTTIKSLDDLGQEFFFSKSYINRIFKESTGSSVWDYIVLKRLLLARTMLQEGKQANIVASECGFCDYSSFYRQFKQRFGMSPLTARLGRH